MHSIRSRRAEQSRAESGARAWRTRGACVSTLSTAPAGTVLPLVLPRLRRVGHVSQLCTQQEWKRRLFRLPCPPISVSGTPLRRPEPRAQPPDPAETRQADQPAHGAGEAGNAGLGQGGQDKRAGMHASAGCCCHKVNSLDAGVIMEARQEQGRSDLCFCCRGRQGYTASLEPFFPLGWSPCAALSQSLALRCSCISRGGGGTLPNRSHLQPTAVAAAERRAQARTGRLPATPGRQSKAMGTTGAPLEGYVEPLKGECPARHGAGPCAAPAALT